MTEIDPNIILQSKPVQLASPFDLASGAMQLRNLGLQGQNQQITLEQNQRSLKDQKTIADLYRANVDPTTGAVNHQGVVQGLAQAGLGDKIPAYQQGVATASKDTTAAEAAQFDLHKKKLDVTSNVISSLLSKPDVNQNDVIGAINGLVNSGIIDAQTGAQMSRQIPGRPEQLRPFLMQKGMETMDASKQMESRIAMAPKYNEQDRGTSINQGTVDPSTGIRTAGVDVAKSMTPDQAAKIRLQTSGALTDDAKSFMIDRLLNGEKGSAVLGNLGRGQQGAADLRDIMNRLPQVAKQRGISGGQLANIMQNTAADARTLTELGAREGKIAPRVQELSNFADQAREASAAVPRGNWADMSSLLQFGAKHSSDAALAKLQVAVDGVINARAAAIGGGVIHVGDQIAGHQLLSAAQGPDAFNAVIDQFKYEASGALAAPGQVRERLNAGAGRTASSTPPDIQALLDKHGSKN